MINQLIFNPKAKVIPIVFIWIVTWYYQNHVYSKNGYLVILINNGYNDHIYKKSDIWAMSILDYENIYQEIILTNNNCSFL